MNSDFGAGFHRERPAVLQWQALREGADVAPGFNGSVLAFAVGIGLWFGWPGLPPMLSVLVVTLCLAGLWWGMRSRDMAGTGYIWLAFMIALGLSRTGWHVASTDAPRLPTAERTYRIEGWVSAIDPSGNSERYTVQLTQIRGLPSSRQPKALRIRVTKPADPPIRAGETINWLVAAKAPPGPVVPGGYDPAKAAYFAGIGGFGFGYGAPEVQAEAELGAWDALRRGIVRWRYGIADRVMARAPPETAGLQAALMTGVRRFIPPEQTEDLRVAGLAHILAISGLHMALLAGGTYSVMAFALVCCLPLSRRYDVRKFAAGTAIVAATAYLVLSGASVATQRAWVMSTIFFLAIILDRRAVSMRSVCVAALITLALHPESLTSVGFQMSFAAVAALVATYQAWQRWRPAYSRRTPVQRLTDFFTSLSVTSLVAGFATGGFALFHFNRYAQYGFAGNLLAMPLFSLFVMPLAVISLLALPLGLEAAPLYLMSLALEPILRAAEWVSSWPGAVTYVGSAPAWVLPLYGLGFAALCMGRGWMRGVGLVLMVSAIASWNLEPRPDLRVSEAGKVAFWRAPDGVGEKPVLLVDSRRPDRYGREQFARRAGVPEAEWQPYDGQIAQCDALACRARVGAWQISILQSPSEVIEECAASDLVILAVRQPGPVARRNCDAVLIDEASLRETGALDIYLKDRLTTKAARPPKGKQRPWKEE